jgi:GNAT superfamily N-acetyltransferase
VAQPTSHFTARLAELQPSQLWISREKLDRVMAGRERLSASDVAPLPVKQLADCLMLTDGHTRAVAAALSGINELAVYWETDDLDWEAYEECVRWCRDEGIRSVLDLKARIVSPGDYQRLWDERCDALHIELARRRGTTFEPQAGKRLKMVLSLSSPLPGPSIDCRAVSNADAPALADLMLDAYRGTVDYNGETLEDARSEIDRTMAGAYGRFLSDCSFVAANTGVLQSACLITLLNEDSPDVVPLLAFSVTRPAAQRRGLASGLIRRSAGVLRATGLTRLVLAVTAANLPARRVYDRLGFVPAD